MYRANSSLVDSERIRLPFLAAHVVAYGGGAATMAASTGSADSASWYLVALYAALAVLAVAGMVTAKTWTGFFLAVDAVALSIVPLVTGQNPASVHVALVVIVLTASAVLPSQRLVAIVAIAGVGAAAGLLADRRPVISLTAAQIESSERAAMVIGLLVGGLAVIVLSKLLQASMATQAEALAAEQRANALQQQFIAMVSHELRTPLTSIRGFAEILVDDGHQLDESERREFTEAIASQSAHVSRLVNDVLVVLRIQTGKMGVRNEPISVASAVEAALSMVVTRPGSSLTADLDPDCLVMADRDRLIQVVRNLIENAVKYGGGTIRLSTRLLPGLVHVVVEDDGPGIPEDMAEAVFDEFVQIGRPAERVSSGFGLGLPIARRLVSAMEGRILADRSTLGGAAFVVELPAVSPADSAAAV